MTTTSMMMISQPAELKRILYPHQLKAVAELEYREDNLEMVSRNSILYSNVGIYADITGYGKTITMVALILRNRQKFYSEEPYTRTTVTQIYGNGNIVKKQISHYQRLDTTLILANQSILKQWSEELSYSSLKFETINNKKKCEVVDPQDYKVILCSPTMYNYFLSRFPNYAWKRFIFDEPCYTKVPAMRNIVAGYHWLITATPEALLYTAGKNPYTYLGSLFAGYTEYNVFKQLIFKNDDEFVRNSVKLPPLEHRHYECSETVSWILKDLIPNNIAEMISAGDIEGAIKVLGGTSSTNLFDLIESEKKELIHEADIRIRRYSRLQDEAKTIKWQKRKEILESQLTQLQKRLQNVSKHETCRICLEVIDEAVISRCCYNAFCGPCIFKWLEKNHSCPLCRSKTAVSSLIYLKSQPPHELQSPDNSGSCILSDTKGKSTQTEVKKLTKLEMLRQIYEERRDTARFVIFSSRDETYDYLMNSEIFEDETLVYQLKGKKMETRSRILETFKDTSKVGTVLFLNSLENGAGINLQEATDVVLFHTMPEAMETQVIGRCYRMGRTDPLVVHHLQTPSTPAV